MSVSIIIPSYNEEKYIYNTLSSIAKQKNTYIDEVIIADANSTDNTLQEIKRAQNRFQHLEIKVIKGGKVAEGRNKGALIAKSEYLLFIDADSILIEDDILYRAQLIKNKYSIISSKQKSTGNKIASKLLWFAFNNIRWIMPETFATGCFFFIPKAKFLELGMFDETIQNSEDFVLSRKVPKSEFKVLDRYIGQDDRRFEKMGYWKFLKIVLLNYRYKNDIEYFRKDVGYWDEYEQKN